MTTPLAQGCELVVKPQVRSLTRALPARSFTPVLPDATVTTNVLLLAKPVELVGAKVAV